MTDPSFDGAPAQAMPTATMRRDLEVRFTGSGSEYFRIWIVNLLLTLVTLGVYYPWAKVRRLRYFYGNTLVGEHPLGFHADPKTMLRGYLLVFLMLALYSVAGNFSPLAGLIAFVIVAAIWPALLKSSLQFRLANTSWRGLRLRFRGTVGGAYAALVPMFVPALVLVAGVAAIPEGTEPPDWYVLVFSTTVLLTLLLAPWLWWRLKKYQHEHYAYGPEQTALNARVASFYAVFVKTVLVSLLGFLVFFAVVWLTVEASGAAGFGRGGTRPGRLFVIVIGVVVALLSLFAVQLVPRPYFTSRMQNLLWSRTASTNIGFASRLRFWPFFGLTLKNWLLVVLTLGLYWPFAAVATARMRLEAVCLLFDVDPQTLAAQGRAGEGEAAGDAAGDLFGFDIGL
jgi:uncharacterized membrane protein YjgN (DUF898 family)